MKLNFSIAFWIFYRTDYSFCSSFFSMMVVTDALPGPKKSLSLHLVDEACVRAMDYVLTNFSRDLILVFSFSFSSTRAEHLTSISSTYCRLRSQLFLAKMRFCSFRLSSADFCVSLHSLRSSSSLTRFQPHVTPPEVGI